MKKLTAILATALLSGCANIRYRVEPMANGGPYYCTVSVAEIVALPFQGEPTGPEGGIAQAYATLLLPVTAIDLPLEAVADTLLLPWDFFREGKGK